MTIRFPGGLPKAFTLSYDDGVQQDLRLLDLMEKYNVKGTFNLNSGLIAEEGTVFAPGQFHRHMCLSELQRLFDSPNAEIACHSATHPRLELLPGSQVMRELTDDRERLEEFTGRIVRGFAYPFGTWNSGVVQILRDAGFAYARTTVSTHRFDLPEEPLTLPATCHHRDPEMSLLIEEFCKPYDSRKRNSLPMLFYVWGHSYEFELNDNWDLIESILNRVSEKEDVWYATNLEIFDYVQAAKSVRFSSDGSLCENPSAQDVWLAFNDNVVRIPAGQTVRL